ncbi:MAG TPA: glycosyltransferase family 1 protein [Burkholderiales bacterium]|nr:glycosyltransferase family 1 protein [Burkholderiales bacterium]
MEETADFLVEQFPRARCSLRVAVVTETYAPEVNGVALSAARFVEGLRSREHEILLVRPRQDRSDRATDQREMLTQGVPIPNYPGLRMGLPATQALVRLWNRTRPDVVHVLTEGPLGWSAVAAARKLKLPVISDFRTNFHSYSRHYGVGWLSKPILAYLRKFHNRTLWTLVPTEALRAELAALGFRNLRVVSRGVDTALFDPGRRSAGLRASWGVDKDDPVLLHVGRIAPEKNLGVLADAYAAARARSPRCRLVMVGDGPARGEFTSRCPDAIFAGTKRGEDLAVHYASADVFLFPSLTETYGNVTLEALASGLAVVAFDYAAAAEAIRHDDNGLLAPLGDSTAFVGLAASIVADVPRARRMGNLARENSLELGWDFVVRQLETLLEVAAGVAPSQGTDSTESRTHDPRPQAM